MVVWEMGCGCEQLLWPRWRRLQVLLLLRLRVRSHNCWPLHRHGLLAELALLACKRLPCWLPPPHVLGMGHPSADGDAAGC